jgi:hypothetical protein
MKVVLPTAARFLLSDDLRDEPNGKVTILGFFPDDRIFVNSLPAGSSPPHGAVGVLSQLCISCMMFGGSGTITTVAEVTGPSGQTWANMIAVQDFRPNTVTTLALKGISIILPAFGTYKCEVQAQAGTHRKSFSYSFEVLPGPAPILAAPTRVPATKPRVLKRPRHPKRHK